MERNTPDLWKAALQDISNFLTNERVYEIWLAWNASNQPTILPDTIKNDCRVFLDYFDARPAERPRLLLLMKAIGIHPPAQQKIDDFLQQPSVQAFDPVQPPAAWEDIIYHLQNLDFASRFYILLLSRPARKISAAFAQLCSIPWYCVFDFDFQCETDGVLEFCTTQTEGVRVTNYSNMTVNFLRSTSKKDPESFSAKILPWIAVCGSQRAGDAFTSYAAWWRRDFPRLKEILDKLVLKDQTVRPVTLVVLWHAHEKDLVMCLQKMIEELIPRFQPEVVFLLSPELNTNNRHDLATVMELCIDYNTNELAPCLIQGADEFCLLLRCAAEKHTIPMTESAVIWLPTNCGTSRYPFSPLLRSEVEADLEIVHLGIGSTYTPNEVHDRNAPTPYQLGKEKLSWREMYLQQHSGAPGPVQRDLTKIIVKHALDFLNQKIYDTATVQEISLFHRPGYGGTTVARCVIWELHTVFPCLVLTRLDNKADFLRRIERVALPGNNISSPIPVVILIDDVQPNNDELQAACSELNRRKMLVLFIRVNHFFGSGKNTRKDSTRRLNSFKMNAPSLEEAERFYFRFAPLVSGKSRADFVEVYGGTQESFRSCYNSCSPNDREKYIPFFFALWAYEKDFRGLPSFLFKFLDDCTQYQLQALSCIALSHWYGFRPFSLQLLKDHTTELLKPFINLLMHPQGSHVKLRHPLLALELLCQLSRNIDHSAEIPMFRLPLRRPDPPHMEWKQNLAKLAYILVQHFAQHQKNISLATEIHQCVDDVFINRWPDMHHGVLLKPAFSELIKDIPDTQIRPLMEALCHAVPHHAHARGHFARWLAKNGDIEYATIVMKSALELAPTDFLVWHMDAILDRQRALKHLANCDFKTDTFQKDLQRAVEYAIKAQLKFSDLCDPIKWPSQTCSSSQRRWSLTS